MGKYFKFFGGLKYPDKFNDLFDENGNVKDAPYNESEKSMWHFKANSFGAVMVCVADITTNHKSYLRKPRRIYHEN